MQQNFITLTGVTLVDMANNPSGNAVLTYYPEIPAHFEHRFDVDLSSVGDGNGFIFEHNGTRIFESSSALHDAAFQQNETVDEFLGHFLPLFASNGITAVASNVVDAGQNAGTFRLSVWLPETDSVSLLRDDDVNTSGSAGDSVGITSAAGENIAYSPSTFTWTPPGGSEGAGNIVQGSGLVELTSSGGASAWIVVDVSSLPAGYSPIEETVTISESQVEDHTVWNFRRSSKVSSPKNLLLAVSFEDGTNKNITISDKTVDVELQQENHPVSADISLVGGDPGETQPEFVYVRFDDIVNGITSYAKLEVDVTDTPASVAITHNDRDFPRTLKSETQDKIQHGQFTGDVIDQIRLITADDIRADIAKTLLDIGADYETLLSAGFSSTVATYLLGAYYSVPTGIQATKTSALTDFAVIRGMNQSELAAFIAWAETNSVVLPVPAMRDVLGKPVYSESDTTAISGYVAGL